MPVFRIRCALTVVLLLAVGRAEAGESLGQLLREAQLERLIGTWVDQGSKGASVTTTYAWKYEDHVLEATTKLPDLTAFALMGQNARSGDVFHMGADSRGGSSLGKWTLRDGEAVLEFGFTSHEGQQGAMKIRHTLKDADTMVITIEADEPVVWTMIRKQG